VSEAPDGEIASARFGSFFAHLHRQELPIVVAACRMQTERSWLRALMIGATRSGDGWALALIVPIGFACDPVRAQVAIAVGVVAGVATALVVHGLKNVVRRRRPTGPGIDDSVGAPDRWAFPSGHTAQSFSVLVMISWLHPLLGLCLLPVIVGVGLSRVFLGVHYPSDVVVGVLIGVSLTLGVLGASQASGFIAWIIRMGPLA
jgi:undecaprenyl-diphosphatase